MSQFVSMTVAGQVAVITVDNPPVNALSSGVPEDIRDLVKAAERNPEIDAIVVIGAGSTFVSGTDLKDLAKVASGEKPPRNLRGIFAEIEDTSKPVVMAIHGTALGAGLELAMAGHYRVLAPSAKVGQPEVNLGLIPGAGGTQRLPRLAGMTKALEMCASGQPISARDAMASGIADRILDGNLLESAVTFAEEIANRPITRTRERNSKFANPDPAILEAIGAQARKAMRGRNAPMKAIEAVCAAAQVPFEEGCRMEADLFAQCLKSGESRGLIHAFFGEREVAKIPGIAKIGRASCRERV